MMYHSQTGLFQSLLYAVGFKRLAFLSDAEPRLARRVGQ